MDLPDYHDPLEVEPLKLSTEHFPLPCSLLQPVLERYTDLTLSAAGEQAMDPGELHNYIKNSGNFELSTWDAILAQTESIGDPALPSAEQVAILRWLARAQQDWERHFPVEEPLASHIRPLKPLTAALAITDPTFLTPGAHPIHRILDTIQASAIGWQPRLGRAGQALERHITRVAERALAWFDDSDTDLAAICAELITATERDLERTHRMAQRVVETEQGRVKTTKARMQAAGMINDTLQEFSAPVGIGEFLKGPWYASAQLVLLKHGADSKEWQQMSATTYTLLDSLQAAENVTEERRQHIFQTVTQLPNDLKRWLLNLHHDSEAVDDAVALVEFAHLRVLRQQPLDMEKIEPIAVSESDEDVEDAADTGPIDALDNIEVGQWFSVPGEDGPLRVQLVLKLDQEQQLVFTNQAGIKVLQEDYEKFAQSIAENTAVPLHGGASFSACLAGAAGIASTEDLEALIVAAEKKITLEEEQHRQREEAKRLQLEREEAEQLQREKEEAEQLQQEREEAKRLQRDKEEAERLQREKEEAERLQQEKEEAERLQQEKEEAERLQQEKQEAERLQQEKQEAERLQREKQEAERLQREKEEAERQHWTEAQRQEWQRTEDERLEKEWEKARLELEQQQLEETERARREQQDIEGSDPEQAQKQARTPQEAQVILDLPMGTWLGFHDGDTPLMAKLAVHDREQDQYFFVNREGIKMRQLSKQALLTLMDRGLVDILEAHSNFRDEVTRIRSQIEE